MAKCKLQKFAEIGTFQNVLQPKINDINDDFYLKGKWNRDFFKNENPIILELGCGKGEYTIGLARKYPEKNFIGIDIKGARIWRGAKTAIDENINNIAFLRIHISFIERFFGTNEVEEIWITFPDPQPKKHRKRLTSQDFLNRYKNFLKPASTIHLKTDNVFLFDYTLEVIKEEDHHLMFETHDLYNSDITDDILSIQTYYEQMFRQQGKPINYLKFRLNEKR